MVHDLAVLGVSITHTRVLALGEIAIITLDPDVQLASRDRNILPQVIRQLPRGAGPPREDLLDGGPSQQADGGGDEKQDDDLILGAVALEAHGEDIFLLGVVTDGQVLAEAEGAIAAVARGRVGGAAGQGGAHEERVVAAAVARGDAAVGPELDDGAVGEAGAFAEGGCGCTFMCELPKRGWGLVRGDMAYMLRIPRRSARIGEEVS
ncbi:MAG: hypothetical protein M1818_002266 [Claussenomyces sp. TS43310]|nr:MAG: hypothetical protein M1818_002266 [Claussenomyces sp. TS43310]